MQTSHVNIRIGAVGDPQLFPEFSGCIPALLVGVGIIEKGTQQGHCAAGLFFKDTESEKVFVVEMTASMLMTLGAGATRSQGTIWRQRFMSETKEYLGDSVYAEFDGVGIILTTENGYGPSNRIVLELQVLEALEKYLERLEARMET